MVLNVPDFNFQSERILLVPQMQIPPLGVPHALQILLASVVAALYMFACIFTQIPNANFVIISLPGNGICDEYHVIRHVMNLESVNTYEGL